MVWFFIILTAVTYSFVMKYVLHHIQKPQRAVKVMNTVNPLENEKIRELTPIHSAR
jgi:hypothetical protein